MKTDYPYLGQGRFMKTQTKIQWTPKLNNESDWDGIELNDPETGITHASLDACTPEALALIAAAPLMLEALGQAAILLKHAWEDPALLHSQLADETAATMTEALEQATGKEL